MSWRLHLIKTFLCQHRLRKMKKGDRSCLTYIYIQNTWFFTASPGCNRVSDGKTHYAWQKSYTVAKVMVYGFCHVMAFPIVPWQNPWVQWKVISMGFAIHHPKRKYQKSFLQTDSRDCTSCFHSAWNILIMVMLLFSQTSLLDK